MTHELGRARVPMDRRRLLRNGLGAAGLVGLATPGRLLAQDATRFAPPSPIVPIRIANDRLMRVTVCLRPFRAAGPRIDVENVGGKRVVHHYGHGGSGWSLSWGSALEAVPLALATGEREIAVIGAGAIGLTTAITAQRMGASVTIYAKERFPNVSSAMATGTWSPDSRLAMRKSVPADFVDRWSRIARASFRNHQRYLGLPADPVEWTERYELFDAAPGAEEGADDGLISYGERLRDITPQMQLLSPRSHPFRVPFAQHASELTFNVTALVHQLEADFLAAGGRFVPRQFHAPSDVLALPQRVIINCTGYGARALWRDESVEPMRGQIAWLIPQPGATYGVHYRHLYLLARRDGVVLFHHGENGLFGYRDANEAPDQDAAILAVSEAAALFKDA